MEMDMTPDDPIQAAGRRRRELYQAMLDLEHSLQSPAATPTWRSTLFTELHDLSAALEDHIATVEGSEGIIEHAVEVSPRTEVRAARLREDHPVLRKKVQDAINRVQELGPDLTEDVVVDLRDEVVGLLIGLHRHRQQGSDFVWEAYDVDIGGVG